MRHKVAIAASIMLVAAGGGAWWWFNMGPGGKAPGVAATGAVKPGAPKPGTPQAPAQAVGVEAVKVTVGTARQTVLAVGTFRSNESIMVRPELASRIKEFNFDEGQKVAKGQVLVRLDAALDEAQLAQAEAALVLSKANYERSTSLLARQAGTEKALDEARAALRRDEALVQLAKARVEKYTLTAPFDGVVGLRRVSVGSYLVAGAEIVNLEQIDPLKVDFRIPESFLPALRVGQPITVNVDAFAGREFAGKVYAIDPLVDEAGRSIVIRAIVDNSQGMLRPGVFGRVAVTLATRENAMFVPEQAIVPIGDRVQVYRIVDGKSVPTFVRAGQREKGQVEIIEGLKPDDMVITAGHLKLPRPGIPVTVVPPGGQPAKPPAGASAPPARGAPSTANNPNPPGKGG